MNAFTTYYQSPIGFIRVSGTETYISEMVFEDEIQQSVSDGSNKKQMPGLIIQAVEQLIEYFHGERRIFDVPINQQGTDFQQKVWHELVNIPYGKTISYLDLSRRLGDPKVIRAAASANGKNNICIIVPCHRVIGSKTDLVGYGGGLWRKKWLLELENKIANGVQTLF
jgi:methylated-DNA-[protein]-cysteine S-methyltransferase